MTVSNLKKRFPNKHRLKKRGRRRDEKSLLSHKENLNLEKNGEVRDLQRDLEPSQCVLKPDFAPMQNVRLLNTIQTSYIVSW